MKVLIGDDWEEFDVEFVNSGTDIMIARPSENLLVCLSEISSSPIQEARAPRDRRFLSTLLIAQAWADEVDAEYGENEYPIEVTYDPQELEQLKMLFDHEERV